MVVALLVVSSPARGFHLDDHRRLTEVAVAAEVERWPILEPHARRIVRGSVCEDLDLFAKWGRWSHYDNPMGDVRGRRERSSERVDQLWASVEHDLARGADRRAWRHVGRIVHHVQDMAAPAHVVPVVHGISDGYERFDREIPTFALTVAPATPARAHLAVSAETWDALAGSADLCGQDVPWSTFWLARDGQFGTYGVRRFGEGEDCGAFASFDAARVQSAVAGTASVLAHVAELVSRRDEPPTLVTTP